MILLPMASLFWVKIMIKLIWKEIQYSGIKVGRNKKKREKYFGGWTARGQGDTSPSLEMPVCIWKASLPSGNAQKVYKTQSPTLTHGITSFWDPLHSPPCSLSLLFSTNKIFLTSAAGNSCVCHLCIIFVDAQRDKLSPEVGIGCAKLGKAA
jgi:hypothetical protein